MEEIYSYDEFGQETHYNQREKGQQADQFANQQASTTQPFAYTGYQRDSVANTYYAQEREYKPEAGRFTGEDIIKGDIVYPDTINHYAYCWNSPMDLVDLDGMWPDVEKVWGTFVEKVGEGIDCIIQTNPKYKEVMLVNYEVRTSLNTNIPKKKKEPIYQGNMNLR